MERPASGSLRDRWLLQLGERALDDINDVDELQVYAAPLVIGVRLVCSGGNVPRESCPSCRNGIGSVGPIDQGHT